MLRLWLLVSALAFGQQDSYWVELPPEGATGEDNASAPDKVEFWDKLQEKAFDEFCKLIEIPLSYSVNPVEQVGVNAKYKRSLKRLPAGNFAVVDEAKLGLSLGYSRPLTELAQFALSVGVHTRLEGESVVVRPLPSKKSCQEVDEVLKIWDAKTALPLTGKRLGEMMVGELWRLPMTLTVSGNAGIGGAIVEALPVSVTVGSSAQGRASVTLRRLSEREVRFRLRLDQATIRSANGSLVADIATYQLGLPEAENILMKVLSREASRQLNRYLAFTFGAHRDTRKGVNTVLEYVLDPTDPGQMEALAQALRGDLGVLEELGRLAKLAKDRLSKEHDGRADLAAIEARHESILRESATFAGLDEYERKNEGLRIRLPLLFNLGGSTQRDQDRIVLLDDIGGEYDIHREDKRRERGFLDIPFLGEVFKHHRERSARVFTYKDAAGVVEEPRAVYVEQVGFLRKGEGAAFDPARRADELMQLIGTQGYGRNPRGGLPLAKVTPQEPPPPDQDGRTYERQWKRGISALTISFNQKAIKDCVNASVMTVLRAVGNTMDAMTARMVTWITENAAIAAGEIEYDRQRLAEAMGLDWHQDRDDVNYYLGLAKSAVSTALDIVKDLAAVRDAPSPEARAAKFLSVMTGDGESGLAYEDILKVLLQLVDPTDISAEFFTHAARDKQEIRARLVLHGKQQDPRLEAMARARARFAEPSFLAD